MRSLHSLVAILLVSLLPACSGSHDLGEDAGGGGDAGGSSGYAGAYIMPECAPDDGFALRIILWDTAVPECSADMAARSLSFYVFEGTDTFFPIEAPETVGSTSGSAGFGNGSAVECVGGAGPCRTSADWTLSFDTYEDGVGAAGSYTIRFEGGATVSGSFDASWCSPAPLMCG